MRRALPLATVTLLATFADAAVPHPTSPTRPPTPTSKKQRELTSKAAIVPIDRSGSARALARRVGKPPEAVINVVNLWTDEVLALPTSGKVSLSSSALDRFLRCHFTNQPIAMDARLLDTVIRAARQFRARRVDIVSAFRAPKYNLVLRKKGHEVARESQHTAGHAVDFRLHGVPAARLRAWATRLRLGGVGFYPRSNFVHVDVGRVRQWTGE